MKATFKVRVLADPTPPAPVRRGSTIVVRIPSDGFEWKIRNAELSEGCDGVTVDWGDGTVERLTAISETVHTYSRAGEYEVFVSDEVVTLSPSGSSPSYRKYAECILSFRSDAREIKELGISAFRACINMTSFEASEVPIELLEFAAFYNCPALEGEIYFPMVRDLSGRSDINVFSLCSGITKIHFSERHRAEIEATTAYSEDHTLGTGTAEVVFD